MIQYVDFCVWFFPHSITFSGFIHIAAYIKIYPFLLINNIPPHGHITFYFSIYQLIDIRVTSTFLTISNNEGMTIPVCLHVDVCFHSSWVHT